MGVLVGVGAWVVLGVVVGCVVDREVRDGLLRIVVGPVGFVLVVVAALAMKLPAFKRHRVTPDSLRAAMDDEHFDSRTVSVGWPSGALVLLRSKRKDTA